MREPFTAVTWYNRIDESRVRKVVLKMGMTDKQFASYLMRLLAILKNAQEDPEALKRLIAEIESELRQL